MRSIFIIILLIIISALFLLFYIITFLAGLLLVYCRCIVSLCGIFISAPGLLGGTIEQGARAALRDGPRREISHRDQHSPKLQASPQIKNPVNPERQFIWLFLMLIIFVLNLWSYLIIFNLTSRSSYEIQKGIHWVCFSPQFFWTLAPFISIKQSEFTLSQCITLISICVDGPTRFTLFASF